MFITPVQCQTHCWRGINKYPRIHIKFMSFICVQNRKFCPTLSIFLGLFLISTFEKNVPFL